MDIFNRAFPLLLLLGCLGLASCDDACEYNESCGGGNSDPFDGDTNDDTGSGDGNDIDDSPDNTITVDGSPIEAYLDCSSLNPNRVYLRGDFDRSSGSIAIVNPANPTLFCIGFPEDTRAGVIASAGTYTFNDGGNVYEIGQDGLTMGDDAHWIYPENTTDNDNAVVDNGNAGQFVRHPSTDEVFYWDFRTFEIFRGTQPGQPYYVPSSEGKLLGVTRDGSLLIAPHQSTADPLLHVDPNLVETLPDTPSDADTFGNITIETSRLTTVEGNPSAWIGLYRNDGQSITFRRWRIDLTTLSVTDDGIYAPLPVNIEVNPLSYGSKMDGSGNLWQIGEDPAAPGNANRVVVRRPIFSSGESSTIVYREWDYTGGDDWTVEMEPFVFIDFFSGLVTGP